MTEQDIEGRLRLISTVLKVPPEREDEGVSPEWCDTWDSLQHIHLVNVSEEEFEMMFDFEQQDGLFRGRTTDRPRRHLGRVTGSPQGRRCPHVRI